MNLPSSAQPDISVVIPVYNAGSLLRKTLDSVLAQKGVLAEVIVIDDGSKDESPQIMQEYRDRIKILTIPNSGGPSIPRNEGVALATADVVAFFDADDLMKPGKLATAVRILRDNPSVGLLCTDFEGIDITGEVIREHWLADYTDFRKDLEPVGGQSRLGLLPASKAFKHLLRANFVGTSSVVCRRQDLVDAGLFDSNLKNSDDRDMWYRLAREGHDFLFLDEVCHSYRKAGGGVTARGGQRNEAIIKSLQAQIPHISDPDDQRHVRLRLRGLWQGYGFWLRTVGQSKRSREAYMEALSLGADFKSLVGLLRSFPGR